MRFEDVARGVAVVLDPLDGDIDDAPLVSVELLDAPLVLSVLGDVLLAPDTPLELLGESFGMLLGALLLGALLLGALLLGALLLGALLLGAGVRLTSPPEVLVTVPPDDAALLGMQSVVVAELDVAPLAEADAPLGVMLDVLPFIDARPAAESALVVGVVPVPLAPFVLFRPVNR